MSACRVVNNWGDGDLPAPYADGDIVDIPEGCKALERMGDMGPGRYKVVSGFSIDEGDAWYFSVGKWLTKGVVSGRLHVAYADRCDGKYWQEDVNWLEGSILVKTADPEGLALRERLIAAGWTCRQADYCPTCGHEIFKLGAAERTQTP